MNTQEEKLNTEQITDNYPKRRKKRIGLILFFIILIGVLACAAAYYLIERQKPAKVVEEFLTDVQEMNFNGMSDLLQSKDLTLLDEADIRDETYFSFFQNINGKMTFKITKNKFSILNGTAKITAHINYIDGSDIYKETITEFLRQIVSSAFSGEDLSEQQIREKLSSLLQQKVETVEDKFSETDIVYSLIQTNEGWKIVSLDEDTVKIMSANFKSVEDEINSSLSNMENGNSSSSGTIAQPSADDKIDLETEKFSIHYTNHIIGKDFGGEPCLLVYYDYTNTGDSASSAMIDVNIQAYQNGEICETAIPEENEQEMDNYMTEIQPGNTVRVCQSFSIKDKSDVTLQASESFLFNGGETTTQLLKLQ